MQFRLWMLMAAMAYASVTCALVFTAPPLIAWPVLALILLASPGVWIAGIVYGRGAWRAFFIGGTAAGILPFVVASGSAGLMAVSELPTFTSTMSIAVSTSSQPASAQYDVPEEVTSPAEVATPAWRQLLANDDPRQTTMVCCILNCSGFFAVPGGLLSCLVYWSFLPAKSKSARPAPTLEGGEEDYLVIEGRLKSTPLKSRENGQSAQADLTQSRADD